MVPDKQVNDAATAEVAPPPTPLERFEAMNLEPMPDAVASELRGEFGFWAVKRAVEALNQENIDAFRQALGLNTCDWLCRWAIESPQAVIWWLQANF